MTARTPEARKRHADRMRKWRAENPEAAREAWVRPFSLAFSGLASRHFTKPTMQNGPTKGVRQTKAWSDANFKTRRSGWLKRRYGITLEEWQAQFLAQGSCCAICKSTEPRGPQWCTDHCHSTGKTRDILCHKCNQLVGHIEKNADILPSIYAYIERHK